MVSQALHTYHPLTRTTYLEKAMDILKEPLRLRTAIPWVRLQHIANLSELQETSTPASSQKRKVDVVGAAKPQNHDFSDRPNKRLKKLRTKVGPPVNATPTSKGKRKARDDDNVTQRPDDIAEPVRSKVEEMEIDLVRHPFKALNHPECILIIYIS